MERLSRIIPWLFDSRKGLSNHLIPRWIFLRALGLIYFSAFYSLLFQIKGLIGPEGILPAKEYLAAVAQSLPGLVATGTRHRSSGSRPARTCSWRSRGSGCIAAVVRLPQSLAAPQLLRLLRLFPLVRRRSSVFSSYQSDGMLLEAGFLALFFAPPRPAPGLGREPSALARQLFPAAVGVVPHLLRIRHGEAAQRRSAMAQLHRHGRVLPERPAAHWIGWYVEHCPHWFHAATVAGTLALELVIVFMMFFPRRVRMICFFIVTPWEIGVILTANYTFLNYLVLALGFLLLDDKFLLRFVPARFRPTNRSRPSRVRAQRR